jgi:hypothetical protein
MMKAPKNLQEFQNMDARQKRKWLESMVKDAHRSVAGFIVDPPSGLMLYYQRDLYGAIIVIRAENITAVQDRVRQTKMAESALNNVN